MLLQSVRLLWYSHFRKTDMVRKRKTCKNIPVVVFLISLGFERSSHGHLTTVYDVKFPKIWYFCNDYCNSTLKKV